MTFTERTALAERASEIVPSLAVGESTIIEVGSLRMRVHGTVKREEHHAPKQEAERKGTKHNKGKGRGDADIRP